MKRKLLRVFTDHHMDLVWRRCAGRGSEDGGRTIASYATLEEYQIAGMLELAETNGEAFGIEQVLSVRTYLEKNPDELPRLRRLIAEKKIELLGCGMAALDTNMMGGETLLRNHIDGMRYRREVLGTDQKWANLCDLFGFSGQYPQILKLSGYRGICQYSRVMQEQKPFYRGIDGSTLVLGNNETDTLRVHFGQYCETCPVCLGKGCAFCAQTGIDWSFLGDPKVNEAELRTGLETLRDREEDEFFVMLWSEEGAFEPDHGERVRAIAAEYGFDVEFVIPGAYNERVLAPLADRLEAGNLSEDEIEPLREANPVATGCYTSRIELKKDLREAEGWYYAAETLAALSERPYPEKKLASLREKIDLCGFHDAVTGSHSDAAYDELRDVCRDVKRGAYRIAAEACGALLRAEEGCFTVFNPTGKALTGQPLTHSFSLLHEPKGFAVTGENGEEKTVIGTEVKKQPSGWAVRLTFVGDVPAYGCTVYKMRETEKTPEEPESGTVFTEDGIRLPGGKTVVGLPFFTRSDDHGDPWGRQTPEGGLVKLPFTVREDGRNRVTLRGQDGGSSFAVTLISPPGCDTVYGTAEVDFRETEKQLYLSFPLPFRPGEGTWGIPFGMIGRGECGGEKGHLGHNDLWPFYDWFAAVPENGEGVCFLTRGLHGGRIRGEIAEISLLRSVPYRADLHNHRGTEEGVHVFEFALVPVKDGIAAADPAGRGMLFNSPLPSFAGRAAVPDGKLMRTGETDAFPAAIFREGEAVFARLCDPYGTGAHADPAAFPVRTDAFGRELPYSPDLKPFEIATFEIGKKE